MRIVAIALAFVAAAFAIPSVASGTTYLGWADQFLTTRIGCNSYLCWSEGRYNGSGPGVINTWQYVGAQGSNATGRANARERASFNYAERDNFGCVYASVRIDRYRTINIPAEGTSCTGGVFAAAATTTVDSCQFPYADTYFSNRMNPTLNFAAESGFGGGDMGYRSITSYSVYYNGTFQASGFSTNCYKIKWL